MGDIWTARVLAFLNTSPAPANDGHRDETTNDLIIPDHTVRHDYLDLIIGAAVLDASGIDDRILDGAHVLITHDDSKVGESVKDLLYALLKGRVCMNPSAGRDIGIVLDGGSDKIFTGLWQACATVIGIGRVSKLPPALIEMSDSMRVLTDLDDPAAFGRVFRAVTASDHHLSLDDIYTNADVEWTKLVLRRGISVDEALGRIRRRIHAAEERARRANADGDEGLEAIFSDPQPLGDAAGDVVKKLSEMTGFGPAREWGLSLAADLRDYRADRIAWHDVDCGVLLSGPPGCGKTTFARALAAECGVDLVVSTYTDWHGSGMGDSVAKELNKQFAKWRLKGVDAPFILFLDEFDSMGVRGQNAHNNSWFDTIINAWLAFLDGAEPRTGIVVVAATNHPDRVDPALRRPGRLDRHIEISAPSIAELPGIVRHHLGIDDVRAARACRGMSPADVQQACRDAHRIARRARRRVTADDLIAVVARSRPVSSPHDARLIAVHESAHAVVALACNVGVVNVDFDRRQCEYEHAQFRTRDTYLARICASLGGRAAEEIILGSASDGAIADLHHVSEMAKIMVASLGYGSDLLSSTPDFRHEKQAAAILDECWTRAREIVRDRRGDILRLAAALQRDRYLDGSEIAAVLATPNDETESAVGDTPTMTPEDC